MLMLMLMLGTADADVWLKGLMTLPVWQDSGAF
jgi:hypothetical protein